MPSSSRVPEIQTFDIDDSHQGEFGQLPDAQPRRRVCKCLFFFSSIPKLKKKKIYFC